MPSKKLFFKSKRKCLSKKKVYKKTSGGHGLTDVRATTKISELVLLEKEEMYVTKITDLADLTVGNNEDYYIQTTAPRKYMNIDKPEKPGKYAEIGVLKKIEGAGTNVYYTFNNNNADYVFEANFITTYLFKFDKTRKQQDEELLAKKQEEEQAPAPAGENIIAKNITNTVDEIVENAHWGEVQHKIPVPILDDSMIGNPNCIKINTKTQVVGGIQTHFDYYIVVFKHKLQ